jgi:hypothetical protein
VACGGGRGASVATTSVAAAGALAAPSAPLLPGAPCPMTPLLPKGTRNGAVKLSTRAPRRRESLGERSVGRQAWREPLRAFPRASGPHHVCLCRVLFLSSVFITEPPLGPLDSRQAVLANGRRGVPQLPASLCAAQPGAVRTAGSSVNLADERPGGGGARPLSCSLRMATGGE